MTVLELRTAMLKLDYDIPIEMFTHAWTRRQTRQIHSYFLWRMADHRGPGHPWVEPKAIMPFKIRRLSVPVRHSDIPEGMKVCWSMNEPIVEIEGEVVENGVTLRKLTTKEQANETL